MRGAIAGDIIGSRYEWNNIHTKNFTLFTPECFFTDDSIMTLAVAKALLEWYKNITAAGSENKTEKADSRFTEQELDILQNYAVYYMQETGRPYPRCGYGARFYRWIYSEDPMPYYSFGNGSAMRVSACAYAAQTLEETLQLAEAVTVVSHDHPEGVRGAKAAAAAIFLARTGSSREEIRRHIEDNYYPLNFTLDEIRPDYRFNETCQATVPQAIQSFLESVSFEDAVRNAISLGGDSDTLAAITGSIAEAYYGMPEDISEMTVSFLDDSLRNLLEEFERVFPS